MKSRAAWESVRVEAVGRSAMKAKTAWGLSMRTTLNIDDRALAEAVQASGGKSKTAVINEARRLYARHNRVAGLADLRGQAAWEGDLDALRMRGPRR